MLSHFRKDLAVQYVKTIVDCNRCGLCDKLDGTRFRFACGHSTCNDCVATLTTDCPTCSPLMDTSLSWPRPDEPQTQHVKCASDLLTSFQDTFQVNVYQQQRISERLKVEKELFPECIQAPYKYFNKRKSLHVSEHNKENQSSTFFPGEEILSSRKVTMNKSRNYVQEWLNSSVPSRSPLSDLKVNTNNTQATACSDTVKGKLKENAGNLPAIVTNRKRPRVKQMSSNSQHNLDNYLKPVEKGKRKSAWLNAKRLKKGPEVGTRQSVVTKQDKNNCDESGIVIDDDCYTIEDTQDQMIDKDRLALLAVGNAENQVSDSEIVIEDTQISGFMDDVQNNTKYNKVPFYRKSHLFRDFTLCTDNDAVNLMKPEMRRNGDSDSNKFNNISVTVENKSFITFINVVDCKSDKKHSTAVQTDAVEPFKGFEQQAQSGEAAKLISKIQDYIQSEARFSEDKDPEIDPLKTSCAAEVFGDKDEIGSSMKDTDYHFEQKSACGILTNIGAGFPTKSRKVTRAISPDSNNSSDKENCDPNRQRKYNGKKKKK